ncbi:MAG: YIP1 family protein [Anaerolineales bacterium]|jgi:hypothetical protein
MLTDRIMAAFMFRREVYAEVENDVTFTQTAWMIVLISSFLGQLGSRTTLIATQGGSFIDYLLAVFFGTLGAVLAFAVGAYVIAYLGKSMFNAQVTFDEVVRTAGLASVWGVVGVVGILGFLPALVCALSPAIFLAWILSIVAMYFALQEALDLESFQTIIVVVIAFVIQFIVSAIIGAIF